MHAKTINTKVSIFYQMHTPVWSNQELYPCVNLKKYFCGWHESHKCWNYDILTIIHEFYVYLEHILTTSWHFIVYLTQKHALKTAKHEYREL